MIWSPFKSGTLSKHCKQKVKVKKKSTWLSKATFFFYSGQRKRNLKFFNLIIWMHTFKNSYVERELHYKYYLVTYIQWWMEAIYMSVLYVMLLADKPIVPNFNFTIYVGLTRFFFDVVWYQSFGQVYGIYVINMLPLLLFVYTIRFYLTVLVFYSYIKLSREAEIWTIWTKIITIELKVRNDCWTK